MAVNKGAIKPKLVIVCLLLTLIIIGILQNSGNAESAWIMCKGFVNVRSYPSKGNNVVGRLDAGEEFETDGITQNGFLHMFGIGEYGEGWVFTGFVVDEEPVKTDCRYVCSANKRVACRRWINGPQIKGKTGWLYNGSSVKVYWKTSVWALTSRGYIMSEWLDCDPD